MCIMCMHVLYVMIAMYGIPRTAALWPVHRHQCALIRRWERHGQVLAEDHSAPVRKEPLVQSPQVGKLERGRPGPSRAVPVSSCGTGLTADSATFRQDLTSQTSEMVIGLL